MKLKLVKKNDQSDSDPLVIQYVEGADPDKKIAGKKITRTVKVGEVIDVPQELAYELLNRYKPCFAVADSADAKSNKSLSGGVPAAKEA